MPGEEVNIKATKYTCDLCGHTVIIAGNNTLTKEKWIEFHPSTLQRHIRKYVCESCVFDMQQAWPEY